jgi:hypothetical protein
MKKAAKISLNLGGLKLGANTAEKKEDGKPTEDADSGFGTFGSFGKSAPAKAIEKPFVQEPTTVEEEQEELVVEPTTDIARVMGFSGFGDSRKARQFDMSIILEEARLKALDRNASNNQKLSEEGKACLEQETVIHKFEKPKAAKDRPMAGPSRPPGPPPPTSSSSVSNVEEFDSDDDDDQPIGPPIPASMHQSGKLPVTPRKSCFLKYMGSDYINLIYFQSAVVLYYLVKSHF